VATITSTDGINVQLSDGTQARRVILISPDGTPLVVQPAVPADGQALAAMPREAAVQMGYNGATTQLQRVPTVFKNVAGITVTAGTPVAIWTPASGKKFRLMGFLFSVSVSAALIFKFGAAAAGSAEFLRTHSMGVNTNVMFVHFGGGGPMPGAANDLLALDATAGAPGVNGFVFGTEE
jgi:hypothetical protein